MAQGLPPDYAGPTSQGLAADEAGLDESPTTVKAAGSRAALVAGIGGAVLAIALIAWFAQGLELPTPQTLGDFFARWAHDPELAPRLPYFYVAFVAVCAASTFPRMIVILAASAAFGGFLTVILTSLGGALGAGGAFLIARYVARDFVQARIPNSWHKWEARISRNGFTAMFILRAIPFSPMSSPHWGAGLTNMKFAPFFFGVMLGFGPSTIFYILFSEALVEGYKRFFDIPHIVPMLIVGQGIVLIAAFLFYRNQKAKSRAAREAEARINDGDPAAE